MDKFQHKLRLLIVTGSAVGFIGGWGMLAHSGKPVADDQSGADQSGADQYVDNSTTNPIMPVPTPITLPPLDFKSLESAGGGSSNNLPTLPNISSLPNTQQSVPTFRPRIRTRSS
jgi:hypothetical protein